MLALLLLLLLLLFLLFLLERVRDKREDESGSNSKLADELVDLVNSMLLETLALGEDGGRCRDLLGGDNGKNAPRSSLSLGRGALYNS